MNVKSMLIILLVQLFFCSGCKAKESSSFQRMAFLGYLVNESDCRNYASEYTANLTAYSMLCKKFINGTVYLLNLFVLFLFINCSSGSLEYTFLNGRIYLDRGRLGTDLLKSKKTFNENSGTLILKLSGESKFRIDDLNLNLSFDLPDVFMEKILCNAYPLPFLYQCEAEGHPSIHRRIEFQKKLSLQADQIQFILDEGDYFASLENGTNTELKFDPVENRKIFISFGYRYSERRNALLNGFSKCIRYDTPVEYVVENSFQCPKIIIRKNKITEITINAAEREFNDLWNILFPKFLPGVIMLGPMINFGYYMKREYKVTIKNPDLNARQE